MVCVRTFFSRCLYFLPFYLQSFLPNGIFPQAVFFFAVISLGRFFLTSEKQGQSRTCISILFSVQQKAYSSMYVISWLSHGRVDCFIFSSNILETEAGTSMVGGVSHTRLQRSGVLSRMISPRAKCWCAWCFISRYL